VLTSTTSCFSEISVETCKHTRDGREESNNFSPPSSHSYDFLFAEINLFVPAVLLYDVLLSAQTESFSKLFVFGLSCLTSFLCSFFCFLCLLLLFCCFVAFFVSWHYGFWGWESKRGSLERCIEYQFRGKCRVGK
jgi:hypothetical protein